MDFLWALAFAFAVGLTVAGLAGSLMEIATGTQLRMSEPFISRRRVTLSLAASAAAGPFMILNDAMSAVREGRIGRGRLATALVAACLWALSIGIVATELAIVLAAS